MRTELYSVRSSEEEISYINSHLRKIVNKLNDQAKIRVLFKTEIDWNPKKIKSDLMDSFNAHNPPELYVFVNALDTKDSSSFCALFTPFLEALEKEILKTEPGEYKKSKLYPHIRVHTLSGLAGDYPAYCFSFRRRKVLVLPRISLTGADLCEYLCDAVTAAKDLFFRMFEECPDGYIHTHVKPATLKDRLIASLKKEPSEDDELSEEIETVDAEILTEPIIPSEKEVEISDEAEETPLPVTEETPEELIVFDDHFESASTTEEDDDFTPPITGEAESESENGSKDGTEESSEDEPKKAGFKAFIGSFIPMKGDSVKSVILKVIVLIAIAAFLTGAGLLLKFYVIDPGINKANMSEIQDVFYSYAEPVTDAQGNIISTSDEMVKNWAGLEKINKEIVAWIKIDNTPVDYPVLFHKEDTVKNQFYLYRNYKKKQSDFGSIFMDFRCAEGVDNQHVVLHGHNMGSDDSMFGSLLNYCLKDGWAQGNTKFYKSAPIVHFDTPQADGDWIIFAVMKIDVTNGNKTIFNYLQTDFNGSAQYMNFIYNIKARSYLNVDVPINENDRLLTLSTCSYETDNMRTVVVARKVRDNEDVSKYINGAKEITPQKNVYSDFASEYAAGNLSWYDGSGKLNGNGDLEFMAEKEMFTVTFVDAKGKKIATQYVIKGEDATAPTGPAPVKEQDGTYYYIFKKWSPSFKKVMKNLIIKPVYDKRLKPTDPVVPDDDPVEVTTPVTQAPQTTPPATQSPVTENITTQAPQTNPVQTQPAQQNTDPVETLSAE